MITINLETLRVYRSNGVGPILRNPRRWGWKITFTADGKYAVVHEAYSGENVGIVSAHEEEFPNYFLVDFAPLTETRFYDLLVQRGWKIHGIDHIRWDISVL